MQMVLLVVALSADVFLASAACGMEHIKIQRKTALCISLVCSGVLFFSLISGALLQGVLKKEMAALLGFTGLFLMGIYKLSEYGIKTYMKTHTGGGAHVRFTSAQLQFLLRIYNNPVSADKDRSSEMSVSEGVYFALAMSMDGLAGGLGAAFLGIDVWETTAASLLLGYAAVRLGSFIGAHVALHSKKDFSWVGGVLFVVLAFQKLF